MTEHLSIDEINELNEDDFREYLRSVSGMDEIDDMSLTCVLLKGVEDAR